MKVMGNKFQSAILQRKTEWEKGQGNKTKQNKLERPKELEEEIKKKKTSPFSGTTQETMKIPKAIKPISKIIFRV